MVCLLVRGKPRGDGQGRAKSIRISLSLSRPKRKGEKRESGGDRGRSKTRIKKETPRATSRRIEETVEGGGYDTKREKHID